MILKKKVYNWLVFKERNLSTIFCPRMYIFLNNMLNLLVALNHRFIKLASSDRQW